MRMNLLKAGISAVIVMACMQATTSAQTYTQAPVTVSKEKVRGSDGKVYYSHVVLEKQTLFSIAKAYGVSVDDICNANPELDLKTVGLKKNSIILIPTAGTQAKPAEQTAPEPEKQERSASESRRKDDSKKADNKKDDYTIHVTKWYEDIEDIAYKYSISKELLMSYNGLKTSKLKNRQKLRIPTAAKVRELEAEKKSAAKADTPAADVKETPAESTVHQKPEQDYSLSRQSKVNALLIMPFKASTTSPSETSMDFYSGVLMAVRELGKEGIDVDLSVYDAPGSTAPVTAQRMNESDICIGPLKTETLERVLSISSEDTYIISPLDHRTASLIPSHRNLIQAPASSAIQFNDLANWVKSENRSGDKILVISEKNASANSAVQQMNEAVENAGLNVIRYSYNILEGRNAANVMGELMTKTGTNRVIINSESEAFVNDVVRNLDMLVYRKFNVVLYSPSKIKSFETIDVENLHNLKTRISTAYYIDYDNEKVRQFILEYRALYNAEPTQFSFQGYDLAYFFIKMKATYGRNWMKFVGRLDNTPMMQTDLLFRQSEDGGYVNEGVRRIVYGPDYSIKIVRR